MICCGGCEGQELDRSSHRHACNECPVKASQRHLQKNPERCWRPWGSPWPQAIERRRPRRRTGHRSRPLARAAQTSGPRHLGWRGQSPGAAPCGRRAGPSIGRRKHLAGRRRTCGRSSGHGPAAGLSGLRAAGRGALLIDAMPPAMSTSAMLACAAPPESRWGRACSAPPQAVSANSSRPISMRRISDVPAPISYSLASRHNLPKG